MQHLVGNNLLRSRLICHAWSLTAEERSSSDSSVESGLVLSSASILSLKFCFDINVVSFTVRPVFIQEMLRDHKSHAKGVQIVLKQVVGVHQSSENR